MPAQPIVLDRARAIHRLLIQAGFEGEDILRKDVEAYMVRKLGLAPRSTEYLIDAGRMAGLWLLKDCRPRPSRLQVLPPEVREVRQPFLLIEDNTA